MPSGMIANGFATLADGTSLDTFFGKLQGTKVWPLARLAYVVALGALNDPRADQLFQEELRLMPPGETLLEYVDYVWDRGRHQDALRILDIKDRTRLHVILRVERGAILEKLGRLDEARAEYQYYFDEVAKRSKSPWSWPVFVSDRYRINGSTLQQNIRFYPLLDKLPTPQSGLWRFLSPATAWADHVTLPMCGSGDLDCKGLLVCC